MLASKRRTRNRHQNQNQNHRGQIYLPDPRDATSAATARRSRGRRSAQSCQLGPKPRQGAHVKRRCSSQPRAGLPKPAGARVIRNAGRGPQSLLKLRHCHRGTVVRHRLRCVRSETKACGDDYSRQQQANSAPGVTAELKNGVQWQSPIWSAMTISSWRREPLAMRHTTTTRELHNVFSPWIETVFARPEANNSGFVDGLFPNSERC